MSLMLEAFPIGAFSGEMNRAHLRCIFKSWKRLHKTQFVKWTGVVLFFGIFTILGVFVLVFLGILGRQIDGPIG